MDFVPRWPNRVARVVVVAGLSLIALAEVSGQSVVHIYQKQQLIRQVERSLAQRGGRYMVMPPQYLPAPLDTVLVLSKSVVQPAEPESAPMVFRRWQRVPKLGQTWFRRQFEDQAWVFAGNDRLAPLDTTMTRDLRARLESHFGKPTRTLGDFESRAGIAEGSIFEFEYWFVLNDSIPLVVTDVNGPFERGVVASTISKYGDVLLEIRDGFLMALFEEERRAPYIDYYYDDEEMQWYIAGFDGRSFFIDPIRQPGMNRPILPPSDDSARE